MRTTVSVLILVVAQIFFCEAIVFEVLNSTISDVTITGNVAEITRSFVLKNPPAGLNSALVDHLPNTLDERSIKVSGRGGGQVVSTELSSRNPNRENDAAFSKVATDLENLHGKLVNQLNELGVNRTRATDRYNTMKVYISHYQQSLNYTKTIELQSEVQDFQEKETEEANAKHFAIDSQTRAAQETLDTVSAMLDNLHVNGYYKNLFIHPTGERAYSHTNLFPELKELPTEEKYWPASNVQKKLNIYFFVLPFDETGYDRELTFTLKYMATTAQWQPEYDIRLESSEATSGPKSAMALRIGLYALVTQYTREDWVSAMLHLSTAQPQQSIHAPPPPAPTTVHYEADAWQKRNPTVQPTAQPTMQPSGQPTTRPSCQPTSQPSASPSAVPSGQPSAVPAVYPSIVPGPGLRYEEEARQRQEAVEKARQEMLRFEQQQRNQRTMDTASVGSSGQGGSISAAVKFHLPYPVTIPSNHLGGVQPSGTRNYAQSWGTRKISVLPPVEPADSVSTRLFIRDMVLTPHVFTYVVPKTGTTASTYLRAWHLPNASTSTAQAMPLLASNNARVFLEDNYVGATAMPRTQPGAALRLDLGLDSNIEVRSNFVTPRRGSRSEDKSGWFTTDKIKYKVEVAEYAFTVRSTHDEPHLVVLSDYLPKITDERIKLELLQPTPASVLTLKPPGASEDGLESDEELQEMWTEEDFIAAVLAHPTLALHPSPDDATTSTNDVSKPQCVNNQCTAEDKAGKSGTSTTASTTHTTTTAGTTTPTTTSTANSAGIKVFMSKGTRNLVWAQWVQPGQTLTAGLKYRTVWPEEKKV